jgi:hypothetical protein
MANGLQPYYLLQSAFTGGEISAEVANRVDLDKYQFAVLQARNCLVKPHGPIYRRPGMMYVSRTKYNDKKSIAVAFNGTDNNDYLLEIGDKYIRVFRKGEYLGVEIITPFTEDTLQDLRFIQSADTMFIASGKYPVKQLARYSDTDWRFSDFEIMDMYFNEREDFANEYKEYKTAGTYSFKPAISGEYRVELAGAGGGGNGGMLKENVFMPLIYGGAGGRGELVSQRVTLDSSTTYSITVGTGGKKGISYLQPDGDGNSTLVFVNGEDGGASTGFSITARGGGGATKQNGISYGNGGLGGRKGSRKVSPGDGADGWVKISYKGNTELTPSGIAGEITLTSNKETFTSERKGAKLKLRQEIAAKTVSASNATTENVKVGTNWKVISHGTWSGKLTIEKSNDGESWKKYREYTSKDDYNPSESGSVTEEMWLRAVCSVTSGTCNVDLTAMPYTAEGVVTITECVSGTQAKAHVDKELANTDKTSNFSWGAWSEEFGYPQTLCFFQDRLCFGGTKRQPYVVWMSRTGDYSNFSVEKASGTVTNDSAIAASFISRKQFKILHLIASTDLVVLTVGNEWTVSGSDTVTPAKINPKMQATRGCSKTEPLMIGNRIVFVQGRGSTVRDMAYSYETDSYDGNDLTLLAKHIVDGCEIIDSCYKQEPDSTLYFVRSDGTVACLAYILDQKVYAWSTIETDGEIEAIAALQEGEQDVIYAIVKRTINGVTVRNIEYFRNNPTRSAEPHDYVMLDAAVEFGNVGKAAAETTFQVPELAGCTVDVLGDGRMFKGLLVDADGAVTLPAPVQRAIIGLPYTSIVELPNVEIKTGDGTMQGRKKQISNCVLRLQNSLGGEVGPDKNTMDIITYDETSAVSNIQLFTGDKEMTLPIGGFNNDGRIYIKTDSPYPFTLLAAIREVSFGG